MNTLFFLFALFCIYTYLVYPLLIGILARSKQIPEVDPEQIQQWPNVSIVIAVHNEAANIKNKLDNLKDLDYPEDIEIVVVSDGSTDSTNEYLDQQSDIKFVKYPHAEGKPTALNTGVSHASGEIIVFMDARQTVSSNCVKELVKYFTLENVGAVSGELVMTNGQTGEAENIGLYWRYEKWIRANESRYFSTAGATGALYAIERSSFANLPKDTLLDDFETPLKSLKQGKRTLFSSDAKAFDRPSSSSKDEFKRKLRTLTGNYQSFSRNQWLFSPLKNKIFVQFLSHKVFRLIVPYAMCGAFITSALSDNWFINILFLLQCAFYLFGFLAIVSTKLSRFRLLNFIKVFLQLNYAAIAGLYYYLFKDSRVEWKST